MPYKLWKSPPVTHRFALCSDTHGEPPLYCIPPDVTILHAGDVYYGPSSADLEPLRRWKWDHPVYAVRGNHDFHDPADFFGRYYVNDITASIQRMGHHYDSLLIVGLGLAFPNYCDLPTNRDLLDVAARIIAETHKLKEDVERRATSRLVTPPPFSEGRFILLTHYPAPARSKPNQPPGYAYPAIAQLLADLTTTFGIRPLAIIEGHIHEWANTTDFHDTPPQSPTGPIPIYRPGPIGGILTIDEKTWQLKYDPFFKEVQT
ncbi:MAG: metallophosphoesterase [Phycisphaerales bacterium]|nr:metallophosphoesterase [Phycisphaerales bacterium]